MQQKNIYDNFLAQLKSDLNILPDKQEENVHNTLQALWHTAAGSKFSVITAEKMELPILNDAQIKIAEALIKDRLSGIPLAHLTQRQHFFGLDFIVNKGHYIPRKETELLAKTAIDTVAKNFAAEKNINAIDLCTGLGTVALAMAHYCKNATVYGSDIYVPAIDGAIINAAHFSLSNRAFFFKDDMFVPFEKLSLKNNTSIIVSAPPYISSSKVKNMVAEIAQHEPEEAFNAGPFGLSIFTQLIATAPEYLIINGYLIFECGLGQGDFLATRINANKRYGAVDKICDEQGNVRVLKAKKIN